MTLKQSLANDLNSLSPFMLTSDFLSKSQQHMRRSKEPYVPKKIEAPKTTFITPQYSDKLFWCFYIMEKGKDEYDHIGQKVFTVETETKINLVDVVREHAGLLKQHKLSAKAVEVELANNPWITVPTFHALCIIHNISCLIIKGKMCYRVNIASDNVVESDLPDILVIENGRFSLETEKSVEKTKKYLDKYWNIPSMDKPLLSISSYKVDELKTIFGKLDISLFNNCKPKTKKDMYQDIVKKL